MSTHPEIAAEQAHIDHAYERLEVLRDRALKISEEVLERSAGGTHQARLDRDALVTLTKRRITELDIGNESLVFGRIDRVEGDRYHIGRLAVPDEQQEPLVVDWRAPVSEAFYRATAKNQMGVFRRRHFATKGRRVIGIDDELLGEADAAKDVVLIGEGALIAALERSRTGRMRDIVETIQSEQDEIIRAPLHGILIVQGGPGTGKTAVALHRAAYLLYTYRSKLRRSGVLLVGPNPVFLRYIEHVLPSLGEEEVRLSTASGLVPRLKAQQAEPLDVAAVKGDVRMAEVLAAAVRQIERPLERDLGLWFENQRFYLRGGATKRVIASLRRSRGPHNVRRRKLEQRLLDILFDAFTAERETSIRRGERGPERLSAGRNEREEFNETMLGDGSIRAALNEMWPVVEPATFVASLLGSTKRLKSAASGILSPRETELIFRPSDAEGWTEADAALIDEASALLGPAQPPPIRRRRPESEDIGFFVERVLSDIEADPYMRSFLQERLREEAGRDLAESEESDEGIRTYGHVLVDEAQDISPMQWRMLARRCPSGSMTILGDLGQGGKPWRPSRWEDVLDYLPAVGSRVEELTINYRTAAEIMDVASRILKETAPGLEPPRSVRQSGSPPQTLRTREVDLWEALRELIRAEREIVREGKVAVIAPRQLMAAGAEGLGLSSAESVDVLDVDVALLSADRAKGLEFDSVIVVEPKIMIEEPEGGLPALYVAMTRATRRLNIVYQTELPLVLGILDGSSRASSKSTANPPTDGA